MRHFIWVFTVCKSIRLRVSHIQRVEVPFITVAYTKQCYKFYNGLDKWDLILHVNHLLADDSNEISNLIRFLKEATKFEMSSTRPVSCLFEQTIGLDKYIF